MNDKLCCVLSPWVECNPCGGKWCMTCWQTEKDPSRILHHEHEVVKGGWIRKCGGVKVFEGRGQKGPPYVLSIYEPRD